MIVVLSRFGRLGNRLIINIHALATALATGQNYLSFFGRELVELTNIKTTTIRDSQIRFLSIDTNLIPFRLFGKVQALINQYFANETGSTIKPPSPPTPRMLKSNAVHFLSDWYFRNPNAVSLMASEVRSVLGFSQGLKEKTNRFFTSIRTHPHEIFVGVHIRRTDYREWRNGDFYWSFETYRGFMDSFAMRMGGQPIVFMVSSDEKIPIDLFASKRFKTCFLSGTAHEDMCALSRCDYLMGPFSSFSRVAAFLGNTLYHQIEGPEDPCNPESFVRSPVP